uniref:Uncharacterized protein n=1 Tax=Alexandrium catenella TaxID=2925 RepID=A0A7S1RRV0_ALECA
MHHYYASPAPFGATVVPGPNANPDFRKGTPPAERPADTQQRMGGSSRRLQRTQQSVHDGHIDGLLRQQHRAMTGAIYGNPSEAAHLRGSSSRRSLSSPLVAAGTAAAAPLMGTRVAMD